MNEHIDTNIPDSIPPAVIPTLIDEENEIGQVSEATDTNQSSDTQSPDVADTNQASDIEQAPQTTEPNEITPTTTDNIPTDESINTRESNTPPPPENKTKLVEKKPKKEKAKEVSMPPIIKKVKKHGHGHHGGAWKIAFADFVTAMMAFFLLMWLVASLNKAQKEGISDYFKQPIKVALFGGKEMGDRQINVQGGGASIKDKDGQVEATTLPVSNNKAVEKKEMKEPSKEEMKSLQQLKAQINESIDKDEALAGLKKQLLMDITAEGLRIQLMDNQKQPMFDVGSEKINPKVQPILDNIAKLLNSVPNKINIQGHTDASPYQNPQELDYTNWELSSQRANAARRELIKSGMKEDKVMMITGFSSTVLMDKNNPENPENRRITILVMKKTVEDKINTNE